MIPPKIVLFLLFVVCISACEQAEDPLEPEPEPEKPVVLEYGTVSGTITDAGTGNPIPGATVKLLESSVETGVEGVYSFQGIVYGDAHTLIVEDADYKPYNEPFVLNQERLVVDVALTPLKDPAVEIQEF
ncbi:MAG: carboxypeptidase-like regulatory domain-containing protein, partial [Candidatus Poribacteria bacterium]|nr:carboxypeptidase-like regulatory domain-containing protein [Candidatus Poribacteria bacterium]